MTTSWSEEYPLIKCQSQLRDLVPYSFGAQAQAAPQVFLSTRFIESATEANMIKEELQNRGVTAFLCNERAGTDLQVCVCV